MPYDILQGVKYDPRYDDQNFALITQGLDEANKRYDTAEASISDALAQYGAIPAVNPDRPFLAQRLDTFNKDISELVNKKYAGDYGAASKEIARRIKQEHPLFVAAKQRYEQDQKMSPLYTQLESQKKLINKGGIDPRTLSTFDAQGNINMPQYNPIERPEYGDVVYNDIGKAIDQMVSEGKLKQAEVPWLMTNIQNRGLAAISNPELKNRVEKYVSEFESKTPFTEDPLMQEQYKGNTRQFIEDTLRSRVSTGTQRSYQEDWQYKEDVEEANRRAREAAKRSQQLIDVETMGPRAQDVVENTFLDQAQSVSKALEIPGFPLAKNNLKDVKNQLLKSVAKDQKAFDDKDSDPVVKAKVIGPRLELAKQNLKRIESVEPILEKNRELYKRKYGKDASDYELAQFIDTDSEALQREYTYTRPVLNPLTSQMLKTTVKEMSNAKFRIGDEDVVGTSLPDVAKRLSVKEPILRAVLEDENYKPRYNVVSGEYYINIPTDASMSESGKLIPGKKGSYKRLYFTPDEMSAEYSIALKTIKNEISKGSDTPLQINPKGDVLSYVYNPSYGGEKADKRTPRIDVYNRQTGKPLIGADGNPVVFSISDMENHIEELNSIQQKTKYTIPWMPITQQGKVE